MQRTGIHKLTFTVRCESGLHIGGSQDELKIGGSDNPVIKNPATDKPYIPGSSLKGKMRGELEKQFGINSGPGPCRCDDCPVCRIFGAHNNRKALGPSRIIVRDGNLTGSHHIENKSETAIDRRTGSAGGGSLRTSERVAEGAEFDAQIVLQVFDIDDDFKYTSWRGGEEHQGGEALQAVLADGLNLVETTGLGGGTSRGSGAVSLHNLQLDGEAWKHWSD